MQQIPAHTHRARWRDATGDQIAGAGRTSRRTSPNITPYIDAAADDDA